MALTDRVLPLLARYNTRAAWISVPVFIVLIWTFAHLNFKYIPSQAQQSSQRPYTPYSHEDKHPDDEPLYFHHNHKSGGGRSPGYNELANAPLEIYVPPESTGRKDILADIWDTPFHRVAAADRKDAEDKEAYYKALKCPVCVNPKDGSAPNESKEPKEPKEDAAKASCPPQPFDISKCPSVQQLHNPEYQKGSVGAPSNSDSTSKKKNAVVSYIYTESITSLANLAFFTNHGLHDDADFVFVLYGDTKVDKDVLPQGRTNINIFKKPLSEYVPCNPFAAHAQVLGGEERDGRTPLVNVYEKFILMDSSVRGPFIPKWSAACWTHSFLSLVQDKTKLAGTSLACHQNQRPHVQPHILATDKAGLSALLKDKRMGTKACAKDGKASNLAKQLVERDITNVIREKGWATVVTETVFKDEAAYRYLQCAVGQNRFVGEGVAGETKVPGRSNVTAPVDPWEVLFVPFDTNQSITEKERLGEISTRVVGSGYSSYDACRKLF